MSDEELRQSLELALRANKVLQLENDVFERYLSRHDPQSLVSEWKTKNLQCCLIIGNLFIYVENFQFFNENKKKMHERLGRTDHESNFFGIFLLLFQSIRCEAWKPTKIVGREFLHFFFYEW